MSNPKFPEIDLTARSSDASQEAYMWLCDASTLIDEEMGRGYADEHPEIITGYMLTCAITYHAERLVDAAEMIALAIVKAGKGNANG